MKKIIVILLALLMVVSVNALTINGDTDLEMCQCETVRTTLEVCANTTGSYNVNLIGNGAKWVSIAPQTLSINAGECKEVFVFVTPECYATAGSFPVELNVSGPESLTKTINIEVDQCHTFDYIVTPTSNTSKPCEDNYYNVSVKNTGKFADEFVLLQSGIADSWVSYPRESFILRSGEEFNQTLLLNSNCSAVSGSYAFELNLSNTKTNAQETKNLNQTIMDFNPFSHDLPLSIVTCEEQDKNIPFTIENVSDKDDTLTLELIAPEFITLSKNTLSLKAGEVETLSLFIANTDPVTDVFTLKITSQKYNKTYDVVVNYAVNDCYNISFERGLNSTSTTTVDPASLNNTFCFGDAEQYYIVRNTGTKSATILVSAEGIASTSETTTLSPETAGVVALKYSPTIYGTVDIVVKAETTDSVDSLDQTLTFENCYGSELTVPGVDVCANTQKTQTITLKNNGTKAQTYTLSTNVAWIDLSSDTVDLEPNTSRDITMNIDVPSNVSGTYTVSAVSSNANITRTIAINMLSTEQCYAYDIVKPLAQLDINCCDGEIIEINVKNNGEFSQEIAFEKIAPPWVSFSADSISLAPGEEKPVYVYFSPPAGTNGEITAQVKVSNQQNIEKIIDFELNVFGGNCGVALEADLKVNNDITLTKIFTRKEIDVEFLVTNDSNVGFNVQDINISEFPSSEVDFARGIFLSPGQSTKARVTLSFLENYEPQDMNVKVNIMTSVGTFDKTQQLNFTDNNAPVFDEVAITGFFMQYVGPAVGIILLIIILVVIVAFAKKAPKSKTSKK